MCDSCPCNPPSKEEMQQAFLESKYSSILNRGLRDVLYRGYEWKLVDGWPVAVEPESSRILLMQTT